MPGFLASGCASIASSAGVAADPAAASKRFSSLPMYFTAMTQSKIQKIAKPDVIFVKTLPAFVPNALWPPMPPKAPGKAPPRPRCSNFITLKNSAAMNI